MKEPDKIKKGAAAADSTPGGEGDVEMAGETTAADTISGPADSRPVGADTMVKVSDTRGPASDPGDS